MDELHGSLLAVSPLPVAPFSNSLFWFWPCEWLNYVRWGIALLGNNIIECSQHLFACPIHEETFEKFRKVTKSYWTLFDLSSNWNPSKDVGWKRRHASSQFGISKRRRCGRWKRFVSKFCESKILTFLMIEEWSLRQNSFSSIFSWFFMANFLLSGFFKKMLSSR